MNETFRTAANAALDAMFEFYPGRAAAMGLHAYDGRAGTFSALALDERLRALRGFASRLASESSLTGQDLNDRDNLLAALESEIFELDDLRDPYRNPLFYVGFIDVSGYVKRAYAPAEERVRALAAHLREVPSVLEAATANLSEPCPRVAVETAIEMFQGAAAFIRGDLTRAVASAGGDAPSAFEPARGEALAALARFVEHLASNVRPRAVASFAIGPARYRRMLRSQMLDLDAGTLHRIAEDEILRLREELTTAARAIDPARDPADVARALALDHPSEEEMVPYTRGVLEDLRRFLIDRGIVTLPDDADCRVEPTPPFLRWAFAMMDTAGVFEQNAAASFYYVTLPDPRWPASQKEEWLREFDRASVINTSIHEAYPGHYVHGLRMRQAPSRVAKALWTYTYGEGWAHYVEDMMLEEGYAGANPRLRVATVVAALKRAVRFAVSVGMHARDLSLEEAARRFERDACMEPLPARKEAERGTFDPGYLNYTLGKLMLKKLRADARRERGAAFTTRAFHDEFLALGAPPFPVVRRAMLADSSGPLL